MSNYNFNSEYYDSLGEIRDSSRENRPFNYPTNVRHNISATDRTGLQPLNNKVVRGFMRSIIYGGEVGQAFNNNSKAANFRLNFQFNPEYIERNVSQSPGAVNPLLQNPAALTQGVPGTARFNFTMLFNREDEVARYRGKKGLLGLSADSPESEFEDYYAEPGRVGVMHDLAVFDKIIGQGISKDLIDTITKYTEQQNVALLNSEDEELVERAIAPEDVRSSLDGSGEGFLYQNIGNSAFLNPLPVRIVFSDMFMVEGLVVASAVAFQKFSQDMVPTVCQVNCEVYALYFGFAQKKAFLTNNLTDWATEIVDQTKAATAEATAAAESFSSKINSVSVVFNLTDYGNPNGNVGYALMAPDPSSPAAKVLLASGGSNLVVSATNYDLSSEGGEKLVTATQWYNAAKIDSNKVKALSGTTDVTTDIKEALFGTLQDESRYSALGAIPITVFIEYLTNEKKLPDELTEIRIINPKLEGEDTASLTVFSTFDKSNWKYIDWFYARNKISTITNKVEWSNNKYKLFANTFYVGFKARFDLGRPEQSWAVNQKVSFKYTIEVLGKIKVNDADQTFSKKSNELVVNFPFYQGTQNVLWVDNQTLKRYVVGVNRKPFGSGDAKDYQR